MAGVLIDSEEDCRTRGRELRKGNLESRAFRVERVRHAWHLRRATIVMLDQRMWISILLYFFEQQFGPEL